MMPVGEDGTVTVWPWLEGAETLENLQGFSAYCQQRLNAASVQNAVQPDREPLHRPLNAEELAALETALNRPLNNYLVRSYYTTNTEINRNESLAGGAGRTAVEATAEELEAYAAQTGERPTALIRMDHETFEWFQGWNLGLGDCELATHWIYLEPYDAWYSTDTECPLLTIQCISGEEWIATGAAPSQYRICYRFTRADGTVYTGTVAATPSRLDGAMERPMTDWEFCADFNTWTQEEANPE